MNCKHMLKKGIIMRNTILKIKNAANAEIKNTFDIKLLEELRVKYLGKNGQVTSILKELGKLSKELRPTIGCLINEVKTELERLLLEQTAIANEIIQKEKLKKEEIDVTMPGKKCLTGALHPLNTTTNDIIEIFHSLGFSTVFGPDIEWDTYNFDMLNMPKDHPARDESDTFFINDKLALRTQTSSVQVRYMQINKPPIRIISPGRVYRIDEVDATHSPMFHQIEGLVVDRGINMGHLKYTLEYFVTAFYGNGVKTRFRPHHFQFTEPSAEMDISCFNCNGLGCRICKNEGWIELMGCGMVHRKVLKTCNIDPDEYTGFAFGIGLDRATMQRFSIDSLKLLFENNITVLKQF